MSVMENVLGMWDRDWRGQSFNGRNLRDELLARTAWEASSTENKDEYTVWGVALHVHKYKELLLATLEEREPVWPEGEEDFPPEPEGGLTEAKWHQAIEAMDKTHIALLGRAATLDEDFLKTVFAPWGITWVDVLVWAAGHDGYHTAQIRNMGR